ncbi:hypothetical protein [Metamycoplasma buccale]|uniref:hypothetical protein n=1 Tax=Metamycoplasma buccale TaxID=55602 RepID=UPI00398EEBBE
MTKNNKKILFISLGFSALMVATTTAAVITTYYLNNKNSKQNDATNLESLKVEQVQPKIPMTAHDFLEKWKEENFKLDSKFFNEYFKFNISKELINKVKVSFLIDNLSRDIILKIAIINNNSMSYTKTITLKCFMIDKNYFYSIDKKTTNIIKKPNQNFSTINELINSINAGNYDKEKIIKLFEEYFDVVSENNEKLLEINYASLNKNKLTLYAIFGKEIELPTGEKITIKSKLTEYEIDLENEFFNLDKLLISQIMEQHKGQYLSIKNGIAKLPSEIKKSDLNIPIIDNFDVIIKLLKPDDKNSTLTVSYVIKSRRSNYEFANEQTFKNLE